MNVFSTEQLIVYTFIAITLLIGLWAGREIKDIRDYAIANRTYGTGVLTITFLATYLGGSNVLGAQNKILTYGLIAGLTTIGSAFALIYTSALIVPKMDRFHQSMTLADVMKELYGSSGEIITGILGSIFTVSVVGSQILALGIICESFLGWNARCSTCLGGLILILYASWGGVKSVTITDVFQFLVFVAIIPVIANVAISEVGGLQALFKNLPVDKLTIGNHAKFPHYFSSFLVWCFFPVWLSEPPNIQRVLMAQQRQQACSMLFTSAAFILVVRALLILTCLSVLVLAPSIKPSEGGAFAYIIHQYLSPAFKGLSVAGLLAIVMSTLDSFLNAGALLLTHNVLKPYFDSKKMAFNELRFVRYITFSLGLAGILVAFSTNEIQTLSYFSISSFAPIITVPLIAGILGLKTDARSFVISAVVTIVTFILAKLYVPKAINYLVLPISLVANTISFFTAHIIQNQGIVIIKSQGKESSLLLPSPPTALHIIFALFMCFNYMVPYLIYTRQGEGAMFVIRLIGAVLCVGLLLKPYWGAWLEKYFHPYWRLTLLYCLPFTTTTLYVLNNGGIDWTLNVALAIMLLIILVDWRSFVIISLTGVSLGLLCAYGIKGHMPLSYETFYTLAYTSIFSTFIGLLFARTQGQKTERQQKMRETGEAANQASLLQTAEKMKKVLQALQNAGIPNLLKVAKKLQGLDVDVEKSDVNKLRAIEKILLPMAFQLQGIDTKAQDYLMLQVASVPIQQLLTKVQEQLHKQVIEGVRYLPTTQHNELVCDPEHLTTLISKSIAALQKQPKGLQDEEKQSLLLGIEETTLHYPLPDVAEGYMKKVQALRIMITTEGSLPALAPSYQPNLAAASVIDPATTTEALEQLANERIVKAHYGYAELTPSTLCYVIPIDLREVRPKDMDKSYMELGAVPVRANDRYKSDIFDAQAQEKEFLEAVEKRSSADIGLVEVALELIKWYHGPAYRYAGEPFYLHPLSVAQIVLDYNTDQPTILGALLHDTVEDTAMLLPHIEAVFGSETAEIVDVVTHLQSLGDSPYKINLSAEENVQMLWRIGNTRALYVKIADRLHNMRTIATRPYERQVQKAERTLQFFVPLAADKLKLPAAAKELKERSLAVLASPRGASS